ncbi:MAG: response regulator [Bradyrhizobium sp.]|uniref:response regulator n=1 Tax=Bradyrhizobium sp. TaxID=376 RepID=UPI003BAF29A2
MRLLRCRDHGSAAIFPAAVRLRQLAVPLCGGFRKPERLRRGSLRPSRHQPGPRDGSGIELRQRLKAANISVPVIYMTGNEDPAVREAALQSGCVAYLHKPFSADSLIKPLKSAPIS